MGLPPAVAAEFHDLWHGTPDFGSLCRVLAARACMLGLDKVDVADWLHERAELGGLIHDNGVDAVQAAIAEHFGRRFEALMARNDERPVHATAVARQAGADSMVTVCMDSVVMEPIEWLWPGRIAIGKVTVLAGDGGLGKSTVLFDLAARLSRGDHWPVSPERAPVRSSVILSSEDDAADTIKPRLAAAGADMTKIHVVDMVRDRRGGRRMFSLQADLDALEAADRRDRRRRPLDHRSGDGLSRHRRQPQERRRARRARPARRR